jgi:hypothetical protein
MLAGRPLKRVKGRINRDFVLQAQHEYLLDSIVSVENNKTLTIEPGTTIYMRTFANDTDSRLVISRGSRLVAEGTSDKPIVFTSDKVLTGNPAPGDWGGILVYGRAPVNQGQTVLEGGFEYGGTLPNDNSGSLRYVRNEFAGKSTIDAMQMLGVGAGTSLRYLQVYKCADNAFRFKGGTADVKYLVCTGFWAYGLWAEHGWRGRGQFWVFHTDVAATIVPVNFKNQARSIELRNDDSNPNLTPATYGYLSNITMIGNGSTPNDGTRRGFRARRGAMGIFRNMIVTNFPDDGVRVEEVAQAKLDDGTTLLADTRSFGNRRNWNQQAADYFLPNAGFNLSDQAVPGISATSFVGATASPFDPAANAAFGSWFTSAPFIGAVQNSATDWTAEGSWCRDLNGNIR